MGLSFQDRLIELAQEEQMENEEEWRNIDEYMTKIWKRGGSSG
jgi:hypothetical protein